MAKNIRRFAAREQNFILITSYFLNCLVKSSTQAIRILSEVAGEFKTQYLSDSPVSCLFKLKGVSNGRESETKEIYLAEEQAFLIAKKTLAAKNNGGSPTPLEEWMARLLADP